MAAVRDIHIWYNPTKLGKGPRWDMDMVLDDAEHTRIRVSRVTPQQAVKSVREAMEALTKG